jgi:hypothetical protein
MNLPLKLHFHTYHFALIHHGFRKIFGSILQVMLPATQSHCLAPTPKGTLFKTDCLNRVTEVKRPLHQVT